MNFISKIIAFFILALLLVACPRPDPPAGIPPHLREIMEANRAIALPPFPEDFREQADAYLTQGLTREEDIRISNERRRIRLPPSQHIRDAGSSAHLGRRITREDAASDINFLFDLMRYGYAGYRHFGGDDVFLPIRDSMLDRLAGIQGEITGQALLRDMLVPGLAPVIADNHFQLHDITLEAPPHSARINEDFILRRAGDHFVTMIDNVEYRLIEATLGGQKVEGILPTLTREGEAAYAFGHFGQWTQLGTQPMYVALESAEAGEGLSLEVRLRAMSNIDRSNVLLHQYEINGVPVVVNRTLMNPYVTDDAGRIFHRSGASLRGSSVIVLDLRGHGGGVSDPMLFWMNGLSGSWPSGGAFGVFNLLSMTGGRGSGPRWTADIAPFESALPNQSLVIALTDNNMGSGGDQIVGYLRELENVIFVGANTQGTLVTGGVARNALPRSGIAVIFGVQLHLRPDFSQFEGVGFMPDLWVPPDQSLERVLAFIERYGLLRGAQ